MKKKNKEAYCGEFTNDQDFAYDMADNLGLISKDTAWPHTCIDWEDAANALMKYYTEQDGYYFRKL